MKRMTLMFGLAALTLFFAGCAGRLYNKGVSYDDVGNFAEATKCFHEAADRGLLKARLELGRRYHDGIGTPRDYAEAVRWYRTAADQGSAEAWQASWGSACIPQQGRVQPSAQRASPWLATPKPSHT